MRQSLQEYCLIHNRETLLSEWHPTKNVPLTPDTVSPHCAKRVWWVCEKGHEWQALINNRSAGSRCPFCSGNKVLPGFNDLATTHPDIATQWHPTKNAPLDPTMVSAGSNRLIWWICEKGHEWQTQPNYRTYGHTGCPYCSGKKSVHGSNDLKSRFPSLAAQWHPNKNGSLQPQNVAAFSNKKAWWQCEKGHEWQSVVSTRAQGGPSCPICSGKKVLPGFNDLATTHPDLAAQWHPTLNAPLEPTMVSAGSSKRVWWKCKSGHEWQTQIYLITIKKRVPCPVCARSSAFHK